MKYVIIGAGGTGGPIAAYMTKAGKDVTVIARGKHLEALQHSGIRMETSDMGTFQIPMLKACRMDQYFSKADVIFVCVKGYSLQETVPFLLRCSHPGTVVIPLLNLYSTGARLQKSLPEQIVTDGCIYISANIKSPGVISKHGSIFRIVFGLRNPEQSVPLLSEIADDLRDCGIDVCLSEHIRRDALEKFSYVSAQAACGLYYNTTAGRIQKEEEPRSMFVSLIGEILNLSRAMGTPLSENIVDINLSILDSLAETASTSMQRDIEKGKPSEIDGLLYEVVRLGAIYNVPTPTYDKVLKKVWSIDFHKPMAAAL